MTPEGAAEVTADDAVPVEPRWLSGDERRAWLGVGSLIFRLPGALDAQLQRDSGVTFFEYMVLSVLSEQPDRTLQMIDIARASSSSLSRLSHTVSRLEKQGLITRSRIPGPGRRTNATLTELGHAKVLEAAPGHVAHVRELLIDHLDASDLRALERAGHQVARCVNPTDACVLGARADGEDRADPCGGARAHAATEQG